MPKLEQNLGTRVDFPFIKLLFIAFNHWPKFGTSVRQVFTGPYEKHLLSQNVFLELIIFEAVEAVDKEGRLLIGSHSSCRWGCSYQERMKRLLLWEEVMIIMCDRNLRNKRKWTNTPQFLQTKCQGGKRSKPSAIGLTPATTFGIPLSTKLQYSFDLKRFSINIDQWS